MKFLRPLGMAGTARHFTEDLNLKHVCILSLFYTFRDILHTFSSMHTHKLTRKDEFVFFLNALPGSMK